MGGLIALAYAIRHPQRVRRLVLVASHQRHTPRILRAVLMNRPPDANALTAGLALLKETDQRAQASSVTCPARLIWGERDALAPAAAQPAVTRLFNDARGKIISGSAHAPFLSHPRDFTRTLELFLHD